MSREYIITMTAENRVGILAAVTNAMGELGAELLECSQTVVSGYFTMIFAAQFPDDREQNVIQDHLNDVCRPFGIASTMSPVKQLENEEPVAEAVTKRMRIRGKNMPGILRKIAVKLSISQIDIEGMHAWRNSETEFEAVMKVSVPLNVDIATLPTEIMNINPVWELNVELDEYQEGSMFTDEQ